MLKRKQPIKWQSGIPRQPGVHTGTIFGHPFKAEIFTVREHSQRTTWSIDFEILGEKYYDEGQSGGVQRALSCLRDGLEVILAAKGLGE